MRGWRPGHGHGGRAPELSRRASAPVVRASRTCGGRRPFGAAASAGARPGAHAMCHCPRSGHARTTHAPSGGRPVRCRRALRSRRWGGTRRPLTPASTVRRAAGGGGAIPPPAATPAGGAGGRPAGRGTGCRRCSNSTAEPGRGEGGRVPAAQRSWIAPGTPSTSSPTTAAGWPPSTNRSTASTAAAIPPAATSDSTGVEDARAIEEETAAAEAETLGVSDWVDVNEDEDVKDEEAQGGDGDGDGRSSLTSFASVPEAGTLGDEAFASVPEAGALGDKARVARTDGRWARRTGRWAHAQVAMLAHSFEAC